MPAGPPSSVGQARRCGQLAGQPGGTVHTGTRCGDAPSARRRVCQGRDSSSRTDKKHSGMLDSPASSSSSWSNTITRQKAGLPDAAGGSLPARWPHVQREQPCRLQLLPQPKEKREDPPPGGWEGTHRNHGPAPASLAWSGLSRLRSGPCRFQRWGGTWETAGLATTALRAPARPQGYMGSPCTISDLWRVLTVWAHSSRTGRANNSHPPRTSPECGRGSAQGPLRTAGDRTVLGVTVSSAISGSTP